MKQEQPIEQEVETHFSFDLQYAESYVTGLVDYLEIPPCQKDWRYNKERTKLTLSHFSKIQREINEWRRMIEFSKLINSENKIPNIK